MSEVNPQLPLAFKAGSDQRFVDFLGQAAVRRAVEQAACGECMHVVFLAGPPGAGKSHLLRAAVSHAHALGRGAAYVPLARMAPVLAQALDGLEHRPLVCLDDVQAVAGDAVAEEALFHFFNRAKAGTAALVFAASALPAQLGIRLPDLVSRLEQGLRLTLEVLDEVGKRQVLAQRAERRGLQIDEAAIDFLFTRVSRDLQSLGELLDRLDHASLAAQRRLTIPFIKTVLNNGA